MENLRNKQDLFAAFLFETIGKKGFSVNYDSENNARFVVDVSKKDFKKTCNILPDEFKGIPVEVRQIKKSILLSSNKPLLINLVNSLSKKISFGLHIDTHKV